MIQFTIHYFYALMGIQCPFISPPLFAVSVWWRKLLWHLCFDRYYPKLREPLIHLPHNFLVCRSSNAASSSAVGSTSSSTSNRRKGNAEPTDSTSSIDDCVSTTSKLPSTSRLMASTISSREKTVKNTNKNQKELSKSLSSTSASANKKGKDKKKHPRKEQSDKQMVNETGDESEDGTATKKFSLGSVVVINEFVPPKVGGRIRLGMVVSMKEYKANAVNNNKMQQSVSKRQIPVRSFQNGRYHAPDIDHLSTFNPVEFRKLTDTSLACVKIAFERANLYYTKKELPQSWEKRLPNSEATIKKYVEKSKNKHKSKDKPKSKESKNCEKNKRSDSASEKAGSGEESTSSSSSEEEEDDDYNERRDRFVAHFYKFQDESGNPMNRVPVLGGREIDLYRFYDVVNRMGGHKRVSMDGRWRRVLTKLHLEDCSGATPQTVKNAYQRYFEKFEFFMKHLGYSSLNGSGPSSSFSRSSRMIRTTHESDWKKNADKRKEKRVKDKVKNQRASSKDSSSDPPRSKTARLSEPIDDKGDRDKSIVSISASITKPEKTEDSDALSTATASLMKENKDQEGETSSADIKLAQQQPSQKSATAKASVSATTISDKKSPAPSIKSAEPFANADSVKKPTKHQLPSSSVSITDIKPLKIKKEERENEKLDGESASGVRTKPIDLSLSVLSKKHVKPPPAKNGKYHGSDKTTTSSDDDSVKHLQKRRGSISKEGRVKSPLGHQAVEEQDVGYSNANIFTRFYLGQKVHARHHLRFYDARIVMVKQPSLQDIAKSLVNAFELGRITHTSSPRDLNSLNLNNMGAELKDALKNMVNATKCFVHYLGWNTRYDEWLMLHKVRVDEKDEKASTKALDSLIPNKLPPQLFAVAMDWCTSPEGIPALATTHAYTTDQQRPRRLSSSGASRKGTCNNPSSASTSVTNTSTIGSEPSTSSSSILSGAAATFHPSKYSVSHHSGNVLGIKPASNNSFTGGKWFTTTNSAGTVSFASSTHFAYQSPLSTSASRSPSSTSAANLLTITTSSSNYSQLPSAKPDSGHSSPLSPMLQHQRSSAHHASMHSYAYDENATTRQKSAEVGKFTIPHLQPRGDHQLARNSTSSFVDRVVVSSTNRQDLSRIDEVTKSVTLQSDVLSAPIITTLASTSATNNTTVDTSHLMPISVIGSVPSLFNDVSGSKFIGTSSVFSGAAPIGIHYYQSVSASQGALSGSQNISSQQLPTSGILLSPSPPPPLTSSLLTRVTTSDGEFSVNTEKVAELESAQIFPPSVDVLPQSKTTTATIFAGASADAIDKSLFIHVTLSKCEATIGSTAIFPCSPIIASTYTLKSDGSLIEEHFSTTLRGTTSQRQRVFNSERDLDDFIMRTSVTSVGEPAALLLSNMLTGRTSPLTTISSCGAVEDFDENSSIRHTETPMLNDDDECASIASNDAKSISSSSKTLLHSPVSTNRNHRISLAHERMSRNLKSSVVDTLSTTFVNHSSTPRLIRRRVPSSKSPESSAAEDNYEEQITHTDTSHAVRLRVQQRMEAEHLFNGYSFIGLPEIEDLISDSNSCEESIKIVEDRMQLLRDIYQTFRGKLTRLERRYKRATAKKKQYAKDAKERNSSAVDDSLCRLKSPTIAGQQYSECSEDNMAKFTVKSKSEIISA